MKYYSTTHSIVNTLNPLQREIYFKLLSNCNKNKLKQQFLTRKLLNKLLHYALGSISNALQILRIKGVIYYNKATKSWMLVLKTHESIDIYDFHIKFKLDWPKFKPFDEFLNRSTE